MKTKGGDGKDTCRGQGQLPPARGVLNQDQGGSKIVPGVVLTKTRNGQRRDQKLDQRWPRSRREVV